MFPPQGGGATFGVGQRLERAISQFRSEFVTPVLPRIKGEGEFLVLCYSRLREEILLQLGSNWEDVRSLVGR